MAPPRRAANAPHHWRKSHATVHSAPGKFEKFQAASQISHSDLTLSTDCFYANPVFVREEKGGGAAGCRHAATQTRGKQNGVGV